MSKNQPHPDGIGGLLGGAANSCCYTVARAEYSLSGVKPAGAKFIPTLGDIKITNLSTVMIREWYKSIAALENAYAGAM